MSERVFLTAMLWFLSAVVLGALFIASAFQGAFTVLHLSLAIAILSLAVIATPFLSRWKESEASLEKSKRQRIDNMLRDMSDDELMELKQRLSSGNLSEEAILDYLSDDGELVERS